MFCVKRTWKNCLAWSASTLLYISWMDAAFVMSNAVLPIYREDKNCGEPRTHDGPLWRASLRVDDVTLSWLTRLYRKKKEIKFKKTINCSVSLNCSCKSESRVDFSIFTALKYSLCIKNKRRFLKNKTCLFLEDKLRHWRNITNESPV